MTDPRFACYLDTCNNLNTVHIGTQEAKGFTRAKIAYRQIIAKVLIDSGNLFGSLISEDFCNRLNLSMVGTQQTVGTASKSGHVTILGRTKPLHIYLENMARAITIEPYVVRDLAHPINLGSQFLRQNSAELVFKPTGIVFKIGANCTMLEGGNTPIDKSSLDYRFQQVIDQYKCSGRVTPAACHFASSKDRNVLDARVNTMMMGEAQGESTPIGSYHQADTIPGVAYNAGQMLVTPQGCGLRVIAEQDFELMPESDTVIGVITAAKRKGGTTGVCQFIASCKQAELLGAEILPYDGIYTVSSTEPTKLKIKVGNYSSSPQFIAKGQFLGYIHDCEAVPGVSALSHKEASKLSEEELRERRDFIVDSLKLDDNKLLQQNPKIKAKLISGLLANFDCISVSSSDFGRTDIMDFHIDLKPGSQPVNQKVRPLNPKQEQSLRTQLDEWLEADIIEPSSSPFASALVPVAKKGSDKIRWCIDYRGLNALTIRDRYPLPNIENNLFKLSQASVYTSIDSAGAFHCLPIAEEDRHKTSFVSPHGSFQFKYLPFGLCNAPSAYSRLIDKALGHLPAEFRLAYIDDVIIYSKNVEEHYQHIMQVLRAHVRVGMKLNLKKCHFFQQEIEYLGHLISPKGIAMIPQYVQKIIDWPLPENGTELARFLGFTGYYRSFIPAYSHLTNELNTMKKASKIVWNPELIAKVKTLKEMFQESPLRAFPDYTSDNPFILYIDFSSTNLAAVLTQVQQDEKEHLIGCVAHKTTRGQSNYPSWKGELAALVLGLKKWEHILRYRRFLVRSDSQSISSVDRLKDELLRGMLFRWTTFIQSFDFEFEHIAGKKNILADSLSRVQGLDPPDEASRFDILYNDELEDICALRAKFPTNLIGQGQKTDRVMARIIKLVTDGTRESITHHQEKALGPEMLDFLNIFSLLEVKGGILFYVSPGRNGKKGTRRVCVPKVYREEIFALMHCNSLVGHRGIQETYQKIRERYFWPHLKHFVSVRVNNCMDCLQKKFTPDGTKNYEMHRDSYSYFGQRVCIDHVTMSPARYQNKYVSNLLTMQDSWTRYLVAVPVASTDAATTAKAIFHHWILHFGVCEQIHSDRGAGFVSEVFRDIMKSLNITKSFTPAYSPQGNQVERAHDVIKKILRSDITVMTSSWVDRLPFAVFAYNISTNRVTGVSPYFSLFGRNAVLPADLIFPLPEKVGERREDWIDYILNIRNKFGNIAEKMAETQQHTIEIEQAKHQTNITKHPFQEGDKVACFIHNFKAGVSRKLQRRWTGPWMVMRKCSASLYLIKPFGSWSEKQKEILCPMSRLRPWRADWPAEQGDDWLEDIESDDEDMGEIQFTKNPDPKEDTQTKDRVPQTGFTITSEEDNFEPDHSLMDSSGEEGGNILPGEISKLPLSSPGLEDSFQAEDNTVVDPSVRIPTRIYWDETFTGGRPQGKSTPLKRGPGRPPLREEVDQGKILPGGRLRSEKMPEERAGASTKAPARRAGKKTAKEAGKEAEREQSPDLTAIRAEFGREALGPD